jgi:hypothetical protein
MRLLFLFGLLFVAATTVAQTEKASDVTDFVSVDTFLATSESSMERVPVRSRLRAGRRNPSGISKLLRSYRLATPLAG